MRLHASNIKKAVCLSALLLPLTTWAASSDGSVRETVFNIQERFLDEFTIEELGKMHTNSVLENISPEERHLLGTGFVRFDVNVPVVVSVMREGHATDLFWLKDQGFEKTDLTVKIRYERDWEVWQAVFQPGEIGLGVNELEPSGSNESYAISVAPLKATDAETLAITNLYHPSYGLSTLAVDTPAWADEPSRYFEAVPEEMRGQTLVQLLRVRRNDSQLVNFNRLTDWPSTVEPDQIVLTLGEDPTESVVVQWRTSTEESAAQVLYQEKALFEGFGRYDNYQSAISRGPVVIDSPRHKILEQYDSIDDYPGGLLDLRPEPGNDPEVHRHTVNLNGLKPDTTYVYVVGNGQPDNWSQPQEFTTDKPEVRDTDKFSFMYMGDVQRGFEGWRLLAAEAHAKHPDARFAVMAGDMVDRGQQRDDWDAFFHAAEGFYSETPIVPVLGNHEYNGLPPKLFLDHFELPMDGPVGMEEKVYSFEYGNVFFAAVDGNLKGEEDLQKQVDWLDRKLSETDATWKFVGIHQPIYGSRPTQDEPVLRAAFMPVLDRHGVDLMLQGHTHGYLRTHPMKNGQVVPQGEGTIYLVANAGGKHYSIGGFMEKYGVEPAVLTANISTYQVIDIDKGNLQYRSYDIEGNVLDEFSLSKDSESEILLGDADGNGVVEFADTLAMRQFLRQEAQACQACDIDGDGVISTADARLLVMQLRQAK